MGYSISQIAEKLGITAHTLRYYDKEGLLPFIEKKPSGTRVFSDADIEWLLIIECLKETGMPIKDIKAYIDWCLEGDQTLEKRLEMFKQLKKKTQEQIQQLKQSMKKIDFKIEFYEEAITNGSVDIYKRKKCLADAKKRLFKLS